MQISTIRPGLLVSLSTEVSGNAKYYRRDIVPDHIAEDGTLRAKWETDKVIEDPTEQTEAVKTRGKARTLITSVCSESRHGLLCPERDREKLEAAIAEARALADAFNRNAKVTKVSIYIMIGRVAQDDVEAVRSINAEVRNLLSAMEEGLQRLDVEKVREAANRAKQLTQMLSPEASANAQQAIRVARSAARRIVKAGEAAAIEIDAATLNAIRQSRAAFIDLSDEPVEIEAPVVEGLAIDLSSDEPIVVPEAAIASVTPQLDLGD
jgi:hypothetical protein